MYELEISKDTFLVPYLPTTTQKLSRKKLDSVFSKEDIKVRATHL
jgi:hypothetical protein